MNTVVFDMDGVLFDSETLCRDSWIAIAEESGLPGMKEIFPKCIGLNANDSRQIVILFKRMKYKQIVAFNNQIVGYCVFC